MSFLIKIFFALLVFFVVGITTLVAIKDVQIPQTTVVETIASDQLLNE
tara:strand:+ start:11917 stop:12060 length:144 start_codon:yes stop_codon:yes gene_type:complete